jgi:hypothetical protein
LQPTHNRGINCSLIVVNRVSTFHAGVGTSVPRLTLAGAMQTHVAARSSRSRTNNASGNRRTSASVAVRRAGSTRGLKFSADPKDERTMTCGDNFAPTLAPPLAAEAAATPALNRCSD